MEDEWTPQMRETLGIDEPSLPVIWDADFLYGPRDASGADTYVLCEINASSCSRGSIFRTLRSSTRRGPAGRIRSVDRVDASWIHGRGDGRPVYVVRGAFQFNSPS
jgi:hypothetical protein